MVLYCLVCAPLARVQLLFGAPLYTWGPSCLRALSTCLSVPYPVSLSLPSCVSPDPSHFLLSTLSPHPTPKEGTWGWGLK